MDEVQLFSICNPYQLFLFFIPFNKYKTQKLGRTRCCSTSKMSYRQKYWTVVLVLSLTSYIKKTYSIKINVAQKKTFQSIAGVTFIEYTAPISYCFKVLKMKKCSVCICLLLIFIEMGYVVITDGSICTEMLLVTRGVLK